MLVKSKTMDLITVTSVRQECNARFMQGVGNCKRRRQVSHELCTGLDGMGHGKDVLTVIKGNGALRFIKKGLVFFHLEADK